MLKNSSVCGHWLPEYWLIDLIAQTVLVLSLAGIPIKTLAYLVIQERIASGEFPNLLLAVEQLFSADRVYPLTSVEMPIEGVE